MRPEISPLLQVTNLRKMFLGLAAVDGISFEVARGSVTGLIGPNGSGKSTMIDCISGFQRANLGDVVLDNRNISRLSPHQVARAGLIRTFQNVRVYDELTLADNLLLAHQEQGRGLRWRDVLLHPRRVSERDALALERSVELLRLVGLTHHLSSPAGILSYGQKKLLALASSLMSKPKLVVLDEPLAGVNPTVIRHIEEVICALNREGETFLIVEHNMDFIMNRCDRVIVMNAGRKLAEGDPEIIRKDARVLDAYLGKKSVTAEVEHG